MKQCKFLALAAIGMLAICSCNSGGNSSTTTTSTDSTMTDSTSAMATAPAVSPATPSITVLIKQKVANFSKWLVVYDGHDSARVASGLHNYVIGRGLKDSNMVLVALHVDDTSKAKEFASSPGLMAAMKKGGVIGKPTINFAINKFQDNNTDSSTQRAIIKFGVKDYDAWKNVFDSDKPERMNAGLTLRAINQNLDNPDMVSLVFVVADMKRAEDFMHSKELRHRMDSAGVVGVPEAFFYHVVKQY
jgi:hypothetical protein